MTCEAWVTREPERLFDADHPHARARPFVGRGCRPQRGPVMVRGFAGDVAR